MAIHLGSSELALEKPLLWIYRSVAILWIVKGFLGWADLLGFSNGSAPPVASIEWVEFVPVIIWPIVDLIAGVALWISWRWGSGVWAFIAIGFVADGVFNQSHLTSVWQLVAASGLLALHFLRLLFVRGQSGKHLKIV
jgi:hypothetical protein